MKLRKLLLIILACLLLPGCWNSKDIQRMAYVTALGLDYKDGKYISHVQILNFAGVAKVESTEIGKNIPIWVGKGEGTTVTESFNSIYATSQIRVFWGHVKALIISENLLKHGDKIKEAYDMLNRYREVRYNILLYGTNEPLEEVLYQKSILNFSPLDSIMDTPSQTFSQRSFIVPQYGYKFIAHINEPGNPGFLPSLSIDRQSWQEDNKPKSLLKINGAYFFREGDMIGWLSENDLTGYRWLQRKLERSPINIPDDKNPKAAVVMLNPKAKIQSVFQNGKPKFNISVKIESYIDEMITDISEQELEEQAAKVIKKEIRCSFTKGIEKKLDVLRLDEALYRSNPKEWREAHQNKEFILDEQSLNRIDVTVKLLHTGKYKGRVS
ncbi:Ger(x)C family spore germination protein [Paenibacillus sp. 32352]|uniref:Ger(x)C family spore germination protein n=1 Tax=Paenibacillus sp. 32352 TaxID=1969111 RepID=UPI002118E9FE|nr:Ger(x)C family spore germination protein [Paenibacillus sp. 32352]